MEEFEKIAQDAILKAERVECSIEEFCEGLESMIQELQSRLEISREEADSGDLEEM